MARTGMGQTHPGIVEESDELTEEALLDPKKKNYPGL
jgi:hypothetical protein